MYINGKVIDIIQKFNDDGELYKEFVIVEYNDNNKSITGMLVNRFQLQRLNIGDVYTFHFKLQAIEFEGNWKCEAQIKRIEI